MRQLWIVDFGSQYTQLITRRARELGHSSEIITIEEALKRVTDGERPKALILSGGPQSVFEDTTDYSPFFANESIPVLGICYGMQLLGKYFGGEVEKGITGEYGPAIIKFEKGFSIPKCPSAVNVWMSHADHVAKVPKEFSVTMRSQNGYVASIVHNKRPIMGVQFHPEVEHTAHGNDILNFFFKKVAKLPEDWSSKTMMDEAISLVKNVGGEYVLCAFSGGVDSLVAATIAARVLKGKLYCFFVDHGLLRPQDYDHIEWLKKESGLNIETIDAKDIFLSKLNGKSDPEEKRKIIGATFIDVFEEKIHHFEKKHGITFKHLLQGTLYPDVIESHSPHKKGGKSVTIKSHHNVGGLPDRMKLKLLEPLRYLFKDEVRKLGLELGLAHSWVYRHPFPGPGIGIRVLGALGEKEILKVQESDQILFEELKNHNLYSAVWQAFTVLLPVYTVGVKGDGRAYEQVICVRIVNSTDGMTATWSDLPKSFLSELSSRITNEVSGVTRVVYDITSKPPGTIEWE